MFLNLVQVSMKFLIELGSDKFAANSTKISSGKNNKCGNSALLLILDHNGNAILFLKSRLISLKSKNFLSKITGFGLMTSVIFGLVQTKDSLGFPW